MQEKKSQYVSLHTHSHYSLLDGLSKVPDLVKRAKELGQTSLALTDHGVMYGAIEFYKKCQEEGIKPIIGCEVYIAPRTMADKEAHIDNKYTHLTLLAESLTGYKNLIKIVSAGHLEGFYYKPRVDKEFLAKHTEGIIALSGCPAGELAQLALFAKPEKVATVAKQWQAMFGKNNYFIEIQPHEQVDEVKQMNKVLRQVSRLTDIPLVATTDSHYIAKSDKEAHEVLLQINTNQTGKEDSGLSLKEFDLHLYSAEEMAKLLPDDKEAIANTIKIAERINLTFTFGEYYLPKFPLPKGAKNSFEYMSEIARKGFSQRYKNNEPAKKQLEYELSVIKTTGFSDYFLIVADIVNWAKENGIYTNTRGSAAGSVVSYCLNISNLDPLEYRLIFERFLNPERISMPDIDVDMADDRRQEVINYIVEKYGKDHVCQIITFGIMKARMVVRDVARALKYPYALGDQIAKSIPFGLDLKTALANTPDLLGFYNSNPDAKKVIDMSFKLENVARHASTHAAGVVVSKEPLVDYIPLQRSTGNEEIASSQFTMYDIETIGLLKLDALGLKNLTIMKNATRIIKKVYNEEIDIYHLPFDDKKTYALLQKGETIGVFQLESSGMQRYVKELKPTGVNDIMAMVALYRPGPMEFIPSYIKGKHGQESITYLHPKLENILKDTFGIAVYQEQILQIAREIAGFTYAEADVLRKAIGKKIKKLLQEQRKKFVDGAISHSQISKELAEKLFDFIEPFARYGFNRAHAASYAVVAYQTAYLKANYPDAFLAALLTSEQNDLDKIGIIINECERHGIKVLPPSANESYPEFAVTKKGQVATIRYGLMAIKNVGEKVSEIIAEERKNNGPYVNLKDFLKRLPTNALNKKVLEALTYCGAFDEFGERNSILATMDEILDYVRIKSKASKQQDLFGNGEIEIEEPPFELKQVEPANKKHILAWEKQFLGIYLSEHPLKDYQEILQEAELKINDLDEDLVGKEVTVPGIIANCKKILTKNNSYMAFARLEDLAGVVELVIFPRVWENYQSLLEPDNVVSVKARVDMKDGEIKLIVNEVGELDKKIPNSRLRQGYGGQANPSTGGQMSNKVGKSKLQKIIITVPKGSKKTLLENIKNLLEIYPGESEVIIKIPINDNFLEKKAAIKIAISEQLLNELAMLVGKGNIRTS